MELEWSKNQKQNLQCSQNAYGIHCMCANVREVIHSKWKQLMAIWNTHINKQMYRARALKFWSKTHQKRTKQWFSRKQSTRKRW